MLRLIQLFIHSLFRNNKSAFILFTKIPIFFLGFSFLCLCIGSNAQNLIPNSSFETYNTCPTLGGDISYCPPWYSPIPYYYSPWATYNNACANGFLKGYGVPYTLSAGDSVYQYANSGNAYAGILGFSPNNRRDYIETKFIHSLKANHCYLVSLFINFQDDDKIAINNLGALITDSIVEIDFPTYRNGLFPANPQILQYGNPIINDTLNWVKISGIYNAHGGEQYITIGNFKDDANTLKQNFQQKGQDAAAYNIDDVSVIDIDSVNLKADAGRDTAIKLGDSVFVGSLTCGLTTQWYNSSGQQIATDVPGLWVKPSATTWYRIVQNVCGHVSSDTVNVTVGVLPVFLKGFSALAQGRGALLQWVTATEVNASHFIVQSSGDGVHFNSIGTVAAKGVGSYNFIDKEPLEGSNYYRLEMVDRDGSREYTKVVEVLFSSTLNFSIAPNPAMNTLTIAAKGLQTVALIDNVGKVVMQKSFTDKVVLDVSGLARGLYFVRFIDKFGGVQMGKVVLE